MKIKVKRIKKLHQLKENKIGSGIDLEIDKIDFDNYKIKRTERDIKDIANATKTGEVTEFEREVLSIHSSCRNC